MLFVSQASKGGLARIEGWTQLRMITNASCPDRCEPTPSASDLGVNSHPPPSLCIQFRVSPIALSSPSSCVSKSRNELSLSYRSNGNLSFLCCTVLGSGFILRSSSQGKQNVRAGVIINARFCVTIIVKVLDYTWFFDSDLRLGLEGCR